jgi:heme/copper-type cytochrome/quinol oxidase subunit 2
MYDTSHEFDLHPRVTEDTRIPALGRRLTIAAAAGIALVLALIGIDVLLINGVQAPPPRPIVQVVHLSGAQPVAPVVYLSVSPGVKPGPDGKLHDAFSVTNFTVRAGHPVKLVINNTDTVPHSITAPGAGVNIVVRPGTHTYTLLVHSSGRFEWFCTYPCDPFSMTHVGYMRGFITSI